MYNGITLYVIKDTRWGVSPRTFWYGLVNVLLWHNTVTGMHRITTFRSTTDRIYGGEVYNIII